MHSYIMATNASTWKPFLLLIKNYQRSLKLQAKTKDAAHRNAWRTHPHLWACMGMARMLCRWYIPCQIANTYIERYAGFSSHYNFFCSIHVFRLSLLSAIACQPYVCVVYSRTCTFSPGYSLFPNLPIFLSASAWRRYSLDLLSHETILCGENNV